MSGVCDGRVPQGCPVKRGLSSAALKIIAAVCMTLDHTAFLFAPFGSAAWYVMRFLGRLAMPVFCFQVAEGFAYTRSPGKYAARLGLLAIISQLPFSWMESGGVSVGLGTLSVAVTLLCGILAMWALDSVRPLWLSVPIAAVCVLVSSFADWGITGVLWILAFRLCRGSRFGQIASYLLISMGYFLYNALTLSADSRLPVLAVTTGLFLAPALLLPYDGRRGGGGLFSRLFYLYYPAHMALLTALCVFMR